VLAFFAALAWLNCRAIEQWESPAGRRCGRALANSALGLASLGLGAGLLLCSTHPRPALLLCAGATSALLIAYLDRLHIRLAPVTLRAAADLALLTPALVIFVAGPMAGLVR
jgi:hypothetical protein